MPDRRQEAITDPEQIAGKKLAGIKFREGDNEKAVLLAMARQINEKFGTAVDGVNDTQESDKISEDPKNQFLNDLKARFEAHQGLHPSIEWTAVKKSLLKANPETISKLQDLDAKGHAMNVFGKENGKFVFVSAWDNYAQVASDHRDINYDQAEKIATSMGVELADMEYHKQFIQEVSMTGWNWLKTDATTRKSGLAFCGLIHGVSTNSVNDHGADGSLRVALRVKEA